MMQRWVASPLSSSSFLAASRMTGAAAWISRKGAVQWTASMASHCFGVILWIMPSQVKPAQQMLRMLCCADWAATQVIGLQCRHTADREMSATFHRGMGSCEDSVPALLIRMSIVPKASTVALTHRAGKSSAVTSPAREMASPPCERISAATCSTVWNCERVPGCNNP